MAKTTTIATMKRNLSSANRNGALCKFIEQYSVEEDVGKLLQSSTQPLKPLLRSASAPLVPSPTREVQPHQAQIATGLPRSIFRSNSTSLELEDMWTLKRASPVFDLDDEDVEESLESPSKRVRTFFIPFPEERDSESSSRQRLPWDCKIREDENGFHLEL
ncbi:hypothetical protein MHU86_10767 [Fragilaria crotonensis]|nr:hypothetical protein MHU86_10767 [Fragilaria crotonensis]